ncbi:CocE/NonD family hydrolase [Prosthecobacter sp.]|uniref:CocE/NonD family hydrolase n=1 Tax=Prosthecobacter sp. TaxID=1965333 RepID=UPI003783380B
MKLTLPFLFAASLSLVLCPAWADEALAEKLRALFARVDGDHSGVLSTAEQVQALEFVKKTYGDHWARQVQGLLARAAATDKSVASESWAKQVADYTKPLEKQTEKIAMRDGIKLATDIYLPRGAGPFPVILARTPYSRVKHNGGAGDFAANGYVFINQDMRGRFESEGENLPFIGCGWGEHQDGVDTVEWIKKQPWCNGSIATIGGSAGGITQNLLAGAAPGALKAQYISVAPADMYSDVSYIGSAFRKADVENWTRSNKYDPRALEIHRAHPSYDEYWRANDTNTRFAQMDVPAVNIGGWFDMFAQGTIDQFVGRQQMGAPGSKGTQKLIMGPWHHGIGQMPAGQLTFPNAKPPQQYNAGRWFEHYLKGSDNGVEKEPAVAYYVMGDTSMAGAPGNEWRYADAWPIPAKETPVYFSGDKRLVLEAPASGAAHHEFTFDPTRPCPTLGGTNLTIERGPMDQRKVEGREDAVVFTSEALDKPVEVTGRLWAKIFVSSSAADTDLSVRICDVYPDGRSMLMAEGIQRLRYRKSREKPELLKPGQIEEVTVDCWSTSLIFNAGHRVRVMITSSNFPRFDVNPGTGRAWSDEGEKVKQTNRVYCDAEHPSRLIVPVVKGVEAQ